MDDRTGGALGYYAGFLRVSLDLPAPDVPTVLLDYIHFSVRQLPARRLAAIVGVNINGRELRPLAREGSWHFDLRIPKEHQTGADLYRNNGLDRGHLVRRLDPVWGAEETAKAANQDNAGTGRTGEGSQGRQTGVSHVLLLRRSDARFRKPRPAGPSAVPGTYRPNRRL